jgi:peptidoglycan/LPS O-acetylase OafA/YrhL
MTPGTQWKMRPSMLTNSIGRLGAKVREFVFASDEETESVLWAKATTSPRPNWPLLAGLRFALAAVVVWVHWFKMHHRPDPTMAIASVGHAAVASFFIISGFSIRHSYMKQSAGFYRRRILRLLPIHTMCFLLSGVPWLIWGSAIPLPNGPLQAPEWSLSGIRTVALASVMMNGLYGGVYTGLGVTWALTVEVLLYLLAPLFAKIESRSAGLWALMAGSAFLYWKYVAQLGGEGLCGVAIMGWLWLLGWQFNRYGTQAIVRSLTLLMSPLMILIHNPATARVLGVLVGANVLICHMDEIRFSKRINGVLLWLGDISFPLYLVHIPVLLAFGSFYRPSLYLVLGISMALSVILLKLEAAFHAWYDVKAKNAATLMPIARAA